MRFESRISVVACAAMTLAAGCRLTTGDERAGESNVDEKELIVLAAPRAGDSYYADVADQIFDFQVAYANAAKMRDDVLVLTDEASYERYAAAIGREHVAVAPMDDIWMRDFSLSNAAAPVMFRYTAAGQGGDQKEADGVQDGLADLVEGAGLRFTESDLKNDGGNWVDDGAGNVVVSTKFLKDNKLSEDAAREMLLKLTKAINIAFIEADEQGGLEHADGVAAFIATNEIVVNSYPEDAEYAAALRADLERGLPRVLIHEIATPYDGDEIYDARFGSACGLYTNMLVTPSRIYFPQFGTPEDRAALDQLRSWTDKEVIPVRSEKVCRMGGGVRCMSWQLRGIDALRLLAFAQERRPQP
ncbi:MAG: agmatine deiminase family protein [Parvularculaceae bacterium]